MSDDRSGLLEIASKLPVKSPPFVRLEKLSLCQMDAGKSSWHRKPWEESNRCFLWGSWWKKSLNQWSKSHFFCRLTWPLEAEFELLHLWSSWDQQMKNCYNDLQCRRAKSSLIFEAIPTKLIPPREFSKYILNSPDKGPETNRCCTLRDSLCTGCFWKIGKMKHATSQCLWARLGSIHQLQLATPIGTWRPTATRKEVKSIAEVEGLLNFLGKYLW